MVVAAVCVTVEEAERVVSTNALPVVVTIVVPADEVVMTVPLEVIVVLTIVMAVTRAVVATGTVVTVCVTSTVSHVVSGSVMVSVTVLRGPVAVAFPKGTVLSRGCNVADEIVGMLVGNGCTGGLPPVSKEVIRDFTDQHFATKGGGFLTPEVSGKLWLAEVTVGFCEDDSWVTVTV